MWSSIYLYFSTKRSCAITISTDVVCKLSTVLKRAYEPQPQRSTSIDPMDMNPRLGISMGSILVLFCGWGSYALFKKR
ncbi:unnamed protein product [Amaranthus hypochondriacus]